MKTANVFEVVPVINRAVRQLCVKPYALHPKGCPNYGKRQTCPPFAPRFDDIYDMSEPVYAVVNEFDIGRHVTTMHEKHPAWSYRQLSCCLYWQAGARKALKDRVILKLTILPSHYEATFCPEAMGVDVTATLKNIGIILEWPPQMIARQVALIGMRRLERKAGR